MKAYIATLTLVLFFVLGCTHGRKEIARISTQEHDGFMRIADGCYLIDVNRHKELKNTPFNAAADGMKSENMFTDRFAIEIADTMQVFTDYFAEHGEFGSLERYEQGLSSDWWIGDDFYSTSRVLFVDLLNPSLQDFRIIQGAQKKLATLEKEWMLLIGHDNDFDARGEFIGNPGEYYFWVTVDEIQVYTEREEDIKVFLGSIAKED